MKILITGGHGYLGRNLKRLLTNNGHHVQAPAHAELDLLDRNNLEVYLRENQFDAIIHTAAKGVTRNSNTTFEEVYIPNILMYENISGCRPYPKVPLIIFGSGAEYDRRHPVRDEYASSILFNWPTDPYGLSKNIITRRAITYDTNTWILRLFGCFNYDEDNTRFIKSCIQSIKEKRPIIIHQQKTMDFFFLDDIVPVIERILSEILNPHWPENVRFPRNVNLTYNQKHGLIGIAKIITSQMKCPNHEVIVENEGLSPEYTGSGTILFNTRIPLIGLREGIRRTINELT